MSKKIYVFVIISCLLCVNAYAGQASIKVIYGDDNRVDLYDTNNSLYINLAKSTAAMIEHSKLKEYNSSEVEIISKSLEDGGVCASEAFAKQPAAANCSGFLVSKTKLVTAGHCIRSQYDCDKSAWVFDFKVSYQDQEKVIVQKSDVYKCKSIVARSLDSATKMDYAVIELKQEVIDRKPLQFRTKGSIGIGADLVVIGHPSGLPTKVADGAKVRSVNDVYLVANLDTYGGNSGSAVFNATSGVVEGILVRGETDYTYDSEQGCRVSNQVANDAGRGEDVTLITKVVGLPEQAQEQPEPEVPTEEEEEEDEQADEDEPSQDNSLVARLRRFFRSIFG
jgi:V8-like Glu-specific endopeptidase